MLDISSTNSIDKSLYFATDPRMSLYELDELERSEQQQLYPDLAEIKANALAVACLILEKRLVENLATNSYTISPTTPTLSDYIKRKLDAPLKNGEKFGDECCIAMGTGFLVGPSKLMTAGHNVSTDNDTLKNLKDIKIIFNFYMNSEKKYQRTFNKTEVYHIKHVICHKYTPDVYDKNKNLVMDNLRFPDWALIELDRRVDGIKPLQIQHHIQQSTRVYMLGHPMGIPLKYSGEASVKNTAHVHRFECDLAAFEGNSGSPVIDRVTHAVIGILVKGHGDYEIDEEHKKNTGESRVIAHHVTQKEISSKGYEFCQKITPIMLDPLNLADDIKDEDIAGSLEDAADRIKDLNNGRTKFEAHRRSRSTVAKVFDAIPFRARAFGSFILGGLVYVSTDVEYYKPHWYSWNGEEDSTQKIVKGIAAFVLGMVVSNGPYLIRTCS